MSSAPHPHSAPAGSSSLPMPDFTQHRLYAFFLGTAYVPFSGDSASSRGVRVGRQLWSYFGMTDRVAATVSSRDDGLAILVHLVVAFSLMGTTLIALRDTFSFRGILDFGINDFFLYFIEPIPLFPGLSQVEVLMFRALFQRCLDLPNHILAGLVAAVLRGHEELGVGGNADANIPYPRVTDFFPSPHRASGPNPASLPRFDSFYPPGFDPHQPLDLSVRNSRNPRNPRV
jgi:hypothetical protein